MVFDQIKSVVEIYHHLPRYREIFLTFFKYGFVDLMKFVHLQKLLEIADRQLYPKNEELHRKPMAERFRLALEELGPTFVKFGQILSSRRDLINEAFYSELRKLQDAVPPFPGAEAVKIVERELGRPLGGVFKSFDEKAIAAASIAQVHRATLLDGAEVAVKIRRPDIAKVIEVDVAILMDVARFLDTHVEELAALNPVGVAQEFARVIERELDFTNEARNMERFAKQFRNNRWIRVPRVYRECSTGAVLVMEYLSGFRMDDPEQLRAQGIDPVLLSERISRLIFQQVFKHGFFHGDPHPGNATILPPGVLVLYDYGMMGVLSVPFRENIASMIVGLVEKDSRVVSRALLGMSEEGFVDEPRLLEGDVEVFAQQYLDCPLRDLKLGFVLNRLLDLLISHKLRMKADFYLGVKALTQVEASGRVLDPDLNFVRFGEPYAMQVIEGRFDVKQILKNIYSAVGETADFLRTFPLEARDLYERVRSGRYRIPLEHRFDPKGFEPLRSTLNHITNRLAEAVLSAAIMVCSSILILADHSSMWNFLPMLGLTGLVIGGSIAFRLVVAIWRSGGM
ncbi:MAG: AarF/ABC1/UbiB kinase family protein [Verrucomicrobia bacterium]|nr:AarF/ABC1/UbiB kinase family protein [Verrucomicrobiota bacterium]